MTETDRFVAVMNNALIAKLPSTDDAETACANKVLSTVPIPLSKLETGDVLCVATTEKRLALVTITALPGPSPGTLYVAFTTFDW